MPWFILPHTNGHRIWLRRGRPGLELAPEVEPAASAVPKADLDKPKPRVRLKGKRKAE